MEKSKLNSKNKHLIAVNLFLIAVLMVVAVYAWFSSTSVNRIDAYDVQVFSDNSLELSFDGQTNWSNTLNLADLRNGEFQDGEEKVLDQMKFISVTGDGDNLYVPSLIQHSGYAEVNTSGNWKVAEQNQDYLKFKVYMRSKDPIKVFLSSESYASPSVYQYVGPNSENKSVYGDFSKDCIVGALRVAGFNSDGQKKFIWITNPNFHLTNNIGSSEYSMDIDSQSGKYQDPINTNESLVFPWNDSFKHHYYIKSSSGYTLTEYQNALTTLPDTVTAYPGNGTTLLAELDSKIYEDGYYHSQAEFVVWIEGCDTESRRALVDGKFNLSLMFDSFSTEGISQKTTVPEDIMNGVVDEF